MPRGKHSLEETNYEKRFKQFQQNPCLGHATKILRSRTCKKLPKNQAMYVCAFEQLIESYGHLSSPLVLLHDVHIKHEIAELNEKENTFGTVPNEHI